MTDTRSPHSEGQPEILTIDEVADMLRVSRRTVDRYISKGLLPFSKLPGGLVRITRADAEALLVPTSAP